jgi:hypothetical protein
MNESNHLQMNLFIKVRATRIDTVYSLSRKCQFDNFKNYEI